ncbi:MAG: YidC/Oxa1 family membrane protein insertase [Bacilli bacterium]|nr:YidC/Oxa1 family membrane protein insertase [Bacilli bacterium]
MKKKVILLLLVLCTLSGCTKRFTIEDKENDTQKSYVSNIVCKPESKELSKVYLDNIDKLEVDYESLPDCSDLKINSGGYEGLWTSLFVKPLAWLIVVLGKLVKNLGLSIMILGLALRAVLLPLSKKQVNMSENMKKAQKDLNRLESKYSGKDDRESMMAKSQEMMLIYKKYDISPFAGCLFSFLQLPLFFAFLEAVYRVPAIMEETLWKFHLGTTPLEGFQAGNYWYIILIVLIIGATYFSFKNMNASDDAQARQMKMMSTFMIVFISIVSFSLPAGIALYWIVSNAFTIVQNLIIKKGKL